VVTTTFENDQIKLTWDVIEAIFTNFGSAAAFSVGARIAAGLIAKHPIGYFPKIGIIGATASGFTVSYRTIINLTSNSGIGTINSSPIISAEGVTIKLESLNKNSLTGNSNLKSSLSDLFCLSNSDSLFNKNHKLNFNNN